MKQAAPLTAISRVLEEALNAPFAKGILPRKFDIHQDCADLYEIGRRVTQGNSEALQLFKEECADGVIGMLHNDDFAPGLRVSKLGSEPFLQALSVLGYQTSEGITNPFIALGGHIFEAWVRFVLRVRGFKIHYGNFAETKLDYQGVKGHFDFILETSLGRKIVCEVKHVSESYLNSVLEPERKENPITGNLVKTGQNLSGFSDYAYLNDTRGYLTQLSVYMEALDLEGLFILWDKKKNRVHVVPMREDIKAKALARVDEVLPVLKEVQTLEDVFDWFEIPQPQAQISRGKETGRYYVPMASRYALPALRHALYPIEVDNAGGEWVTGGKPRSKEEALKHGLDSGYFFAEHLRILAAA